MSFLRSEQRRRRRCFIANTDFEARLAGRRPGPLGPPLEWAMLPFVRAGDQVVAGADFDGGLLRSLGAPEATRVERPDPDSLLVPWAQCVDQGYGEAVSASAAARCHSKLWSHRLATRYGLGVAGAEVIEDLDALADWVARHGAVASYVLKPPYSVAGRGTYRGHGDLLDGHGRGFAERHLARGALIAQPWLDRAGDYSVIGEVDAQGRLELWGVTEMLVRGGTYRGSRVGDWDLCGAGLPEEAKERLVRCARRVAEALAVEGYVGPFGVDALLAADGVLVELLEVNVRMTMGHVAWMLHARAGGGGVGELCRYPEAPPRALLSLPGSFYFRCAKGRADLTTDSRGSA